MESDTCPTLSTMLLKTSLLVFLISIFLVSAKAQDFVGSVRSSLARGSLAEAQSKLKMYRDARGITPEYLEAFSWIAREKLGQNDFPAAEKFADETYKLCVAELKNRRLDAEPRLPIALGAAIEVHAQAVAAQGDRTEAVNYLRQELRKYPGTSIAARVRKNINLLSLEGKIAPP